MIDPVAEKKRQEAVKKEKVEAKRRYSLELERQAKVAEEIRVKKRLSVT